MVGGVATVIGEQTSSVIDDALAQPTLAAAFQFMTAARADQPGLRGLRGEPSLTFGEWRRRSTNIAGGLSAIGVRRGERVALMLPNGIDFHLIDFGALLLGAIPFSMYNTAPVGQLLHCVDNSEATVLVTIAEYADRLREVMRLRSDIRRLVVIDGDGGEEPSLAELEAACPSGFDSEATAAQVASDDLATLVYTSGTTGPPKAVTYRHSALMFALGSMRERLPVSLGGRVVAYLPMAHIAERLMGHYAAAGWGVEVTPLADTAALHETLREVHPTRFFGVPRIYEKLLGAMERRISELPEDVARATRAAMQDGLDRVRAQQAGQEPAPDLTGRLAAADATYLAPLRASLGLDQAEVVLVSAAPCPRDMIETFHAVGLPLNELWGSSETIMCTASPLDRIRLGTAGVPYSGVEARLADDGEVLIKSPMVTQGYLKDPERTAEAFDADGWFLTGDVATIDEAGYFQIVDRKKELIINSGGKNMSPVNIEQAILFGAPLIANVLAYGDGRAYNVALIVLSADGVAAFSAQHGRSFASIAEAASDPAILAEVEASVGRGNERLSRIEQIKRFRVLDTEWVPGGDELTLTAKTKRKEIVRKYADVIAELYAQPRSDAAAPGAPAPAASAPARAEHVYQTLTVERPRAGVVLLTLNRPDRLNAMTVQMFEELTAFAAAIRPDEECRVVVVTGAGRGFCAGYDLDDAAGLFELSPRQMFVRQETAWRAVAGLRGLPQPVVAAVNGAAAGGGLSLALAADIRVASTEARFNAAFVRIGMTAGDLGASWHLPRVVGLGLAAELMYTGRFVDAQEAKEIGLANRVVPADELLDAALGLAEDIARNSPFGVELSKRSLLANIDAPSLHGAIELENRGQTLITRGEDMAEALNAFREKRTPKFTGR